MEEGGNRRRKTRLLVFLWFVISHTQLIIIGKFRAQRAVGVWRLAPIHRINMFGKKVSLRIERYDCVFIMEEIAKVGNITLGTLNRRATVVLTRWQDGFETDHMLNLIPDNDISDDGAASMSKSICLLWGGQMILLIFSTFLSGRPRMYTSRRYIRAVYHPLFGERVVGSVKTDSCGSLSWFIPTMDHPPGLIIITLAEQSTEISPQWKCSMRPRGFSSILWGVCGILVCWNGTKW